MSTKATIATLLALTASAAAQPHAPVSHTCEVRFVRAPDDVRYVIETWLAAEPHCSSKIDLRVIPTEHGFYLIAQRPDGRLHERYVPDAQSAGVLVASWVADDWVAPRQAPRTSDVWNAPRPGAPAAVPTGMVPQYTTPSETSAVAVAQPRAPRREGSPRWLSLGAMFDTDRPEDGGLRAEMDVIARGALTLGISLAYSETQMRVFNPYNYDDTIRSDDFAATIYGAYTLRYGRWELRGAVGGGAVYSEIDGMMDRSPSSWSEAEPFYATGGGVVLTASLLATMRLGERWGISAGLTSHAITQQFPTNLESDLQRNDTRVFFFTGLRRRI